MGDDNNECARDAEPCGSPDCGRCLPVCNACGHDHEDEAHEDDAWDLELAEINAADDEAA